MDNHQCISNIEMKDTEITTEKKKRGRKPIDPELKKERQKENFNKWYKEHREEQNKKKKELYQQNKDEILVKAKEYYQENRDKILENSKNIQEKYRLLYKLIKEEVIDNPEIPTVCKEKIQQVLCN